MLWRWVTLFLLLSSPVGASSAQQAPHPPAQHPTPLAHEEVSSEDPTLEASIQTDDINTTAGREVLVLTVKARRESLSGQQPIGELLLRWTTPSGKKTSVPLRLVTDDVWANQIDPGPEPGVHGLHFLAFIDDPSAKEQKIIEEKYSLDMPQLLLMRGAQENLKSPESPDETHADPALEAAHPDSVDTSLPPSAASIPAKKKKSGMMILILVAGVLGFLFLALLGIVGFVIYKKMPRRIKNIEEPLPAEEPREAVPQGHESLSSPQAGIDPTMLMNEPETPEKLPDDLSSDELINSLQESLKEAPLDDDSGEQTINDEIEPAASSDALANQETLFDQPPPSEDSLPEPRITPEEEDEKLDLNNLSF